MKLSIALALLSTTTVTGFTAFNTRRSFSTKLSNAAEDAADGAKTNMFGRPTVKPILDSVDSPKDMKNMDIRTLKQVSL